MRKKALALTLATATNLACALPTQVIVEAEAVSGGTISSDIHASGDSTVLRSTDGIYAWWISETSSLTTGSYSLYVRVALAPGVTGTKNFGPQIFYGTSQIASGGVQVTSATYKWLRVTSFDLTQIGGQLRISDWSSAGLKVDKLAIVKDSQTEAELVSQGAGVSIVNDASALGGKALTRVAGGAYYGWAVPQANLAPGDYDVYIRVRSADNAPHYLYSYVHLDGVALPNVQILANSSSYQWIKANSFTTAGGTQQVTLSDYSEPNMNVDAIRLVRKTPYDRHASAQILFAAGGAALGPPELVDFVEPLTWAGVKDAGRVSIVRVSPTLTYMYFRQYQDQLSGEHYQMYMASSTDGGKTFTVNPNPIIKIGDMINAGGPSNNPTAPNPLRDAYDQHVTRDANGKFHMVFEGSAGTCGFSAMTASSDDGVTWTPRSAAVCGQENVDGFAGASTPAYYQNVDRNEQYVQWVGANRSLEITRRYQATLPAGGLYSSTLSIKSQAASDPYVLPVGATGTWDEKNFGAGDVFYESGNYYTLYEGADYYGCRGGSWGIGIARTATPEVNASLIRSAKNPLFKNIDPGNPNCWVQYPDLVDLPDGTYLYYNDPLTNYGTTQSTFRRKVLVN